MKIQTPIGEIEASKETWLNIQDMAQDAMIANDVILGRANRGQTFRDMIMIIDDAFKKELEDEYGETD